MIRLRLFGTIELVDPDGREIGPVLQQSKRLALLALLAGVGSEWHRRDTLVATFWPERDTEHARASLRRALTFLRTHLGDGVLRTRGDEVGVATEALWCDLAACLAALREGRHAEAVELRRGELLPGLHVPSAPDFERWLDGMRERVRQDTAAAAARLAADAERAGALADAAAWRRRALELHPHDETGLRALLVLLDRLGDRAGALRAYDEFTTRLAQELDLPPDPETTALAGRIRARAQTVSAPVTAGHARSRNVVAVFPFTVRGPADVQYLREGIVDLLAAKLDGAGELRTADSGSVLARAEALGAGAPDPAAARAIAAELGAGAFVLGSLVADGERVLVRATLHETDGTRDVRAGAEGSTNASIFSLVDDFVRDLLASRTESLGGQLTRLGARMTTSLPALRAYLDGERALRRGRARESRAAYGRAAELDPGFVLPHYRLATAHAACAAPLAALQAVERAMSGGRRLSPHVRGLLGVQRALLHGALADAERQCLRLLAERPDDVEAWYRLARVQLDGNRLRGRPEAEARVALERTCALDPRHAAGLADLARLAWTTGDRAAARAHARRYLDLSPDGDDAAVMAVIGQTDDAAERLAAARPNAFHQLAGMQLLGFDVGPPVPSAALGPWASILAAHVAAAGGAVTEARAALGRAAQFDPALALDHEAFLATQRGCRQIGSDDLADRLRAHGEAGADASGTLSALLRPVTAPHALALLRLADGAPDEALAGARACAAAPVPAWAASLATALATGIEAGLAYERDGPARALALLDGISLGPWIHLAADVPQCALVAERLLRIRALQALGRHEEAEAWRTPPATLRPFEWPLLAAI